jgi:hypothetical protein
MRLRRSRRGNLILLSTRPVPPPDLRRSARFARRRRFRLVRTGTLLMVIGVMRLARLARSRWRISIGISGALLEILGHVAFTGPARHTVDLLGLIVILYACLKSDDPARSRRTALPQVGWRWHG